MATDMIRCPGCGVKMDLSTFGARPDQVICPRCQTRSIVPPKPAPEPIELIQPASPQMVTPVQRPEAPMQAQPMVVPSQGAVSPGVAVPASSVGGALQPNLEAQPQMALQPQGPVPTQAAVQPQIQPQIQPQVQPQPQAQAQQPLQQSVPLQQSPMAQPQASVQPMAQVQPAVQAAVQPQGQQQPPIQVQPQPQPQIQPQAPVQSVMQPQPQGQAPMTPAAVPPPAAPLIQPQLRPSVSMPQSAPIQEPSSSAFAPGSSGIGVASAPRNASAFDRGFDGPSQPQASAFSGSSLSQATTAIPSPSMAAPPPQPVFTPAPPVDSRPLIDEFAIESSTFFDIPAEEPEPRTEVLPIDRHGNIEPLAFSIIGVLSVVLLFPPIGLALCIAALMMSKEEKRYGLYNAHGGVAKAIAIIGILINCALLIAQIVLFVMAGMEPAVLLSYFL